MRSVLARFVSCGTRSLLLASSLLICLACATSFPIESLEEGMTTETVRESFGEPEFIGKLRPTVSFWTYPHEEKTLFNWVATFHPLVPLLIPLNHLVEGEPWNEFYVTSMPVVLQFDEEKLVRWEVIEPVPVVYSGSTYQDMFPSTMTFPTKDWRHHAKGHKHHHGH
jgi:hypothetical protein